MTVLAMWRVELSAECPECGEMIDVLWDAIENGVSVQLNKRLPMGKSFKAECSACGAEFIAKIGAE